MNPAATGLVMLFMHHPRYGRPPELEAIPGVGTRIPLQEPGLCNGSQNAPGNQGGFRNLRPTSKATARFGGDDRSAS